MKLQYRAINLIATEVPIVAGTPATFTLTKPNSKIVTKIVLIDPNGQATAQFMLGKSDQRGTYRGNVSMVVLGETITAQASVEVI